MYTVKEDSAEIYAKPPYNKFPKAVYEAYRESMGFPDYMKPFDYQDFDVKMAWVFACLNARESARKIEHIYGADLYWGYYNAVDGIALRNDNVELVPVFIAMPERTREAWNAAAAKLKAMYV